MLRAILRKAAFTVSSSIYWNAAIDRVEKVLLHLLSLSDGRHGLGLQLQVD